MLKVTETLAFSQNVSGLYAYLDHLRTLGALRQSVTDQSLWLLQLLSAWKSICCLTLFYGTADFSDDDREQYRKKRADTCTEPHARHIWFLLLTQTLVTQMMKCQMNQHRKCSLANPRVWPKGTAVNKARLCEASSPFLKATRSSESLALNLLLHQSPALRTGNMCPDKKYRTFEEEKKNKYGLHNNYVNNKYASDHELQTYEQLQTPK